MMEHITKRDDEHDFDFDEHDFELDELSDLATAYALDVEKKIVGRSAHFA